MTRLTVTARGQVTFRKDILKHLGIRPGDRIALELLPGGRAELLADPAVGSIGDFVGVLAGKRKKVATLDELDRAAQGGWTERP